MVVAARDLCVADKGRQCPHGQEEVDSRWVPECVADGVGTAGHDAVNVGVVPEKTKAWAAAR